MLLVGSGFRVSEYARVALLSSRLVGKGVTLCQGSKLRVSKLKRIILSEEEKKRIELKINHLQKMRRRPRGNCKKCNRPFKKHKSEKFGHPLYCSTYCALGKARPLSIREQEKHLPKNVKKKNRQVRRQVKKAVAVDFYYSDAWRELRYKILRKFGFKCLSCGMKPPEVVLHVDHIKPRSKFPELELESDNLQVLCEACNMGKKHHFEDDLRPK